jgi:excisionase family DNA binding protein
MTGSGPSGDGQVSLREAAEILGVHYMTAYRHVRTGRLRATLIDGEWRIDRRDLEHNGKAPAAKPGRSRGVVATRRRLVERLVAGDEAGAWALIEDAIVGGLDPVGVHLQLLAPALAAVGDGWEAGTVTVDEEHLASAVCHRLIGRLGPRFVRPGRRRGSVVLAGAPGDAHALPVALAADVVRAAGYAVVDLGASVPPQHLARAVAGADRLVAIGICVSVSGNEASVTEAIAAVRRAAPNAPVFLGGPATSPDLAAGLGADAHAADAAQLVALLRSSPAGPARPAGPA